VVHAIFFILIYSLLAQACEELGAGEILLNCIDMDGQNKGYDA
jgi:imidazole glycerol phosphate synthase subunit HisF